ncbi:MAG TPA: hypothetical protein VF696_02805 [Candidatus Paceibacterota bacterium]|jgi:CHASE3 domain sensor protein
MHLHSTKTSTTPTAESSTGSLISVMLILVIMVAGAFYSVSEHLASADAAKTTRTP